MKKITAYVKPFKLEAVLSRLPAQGIFEVLIAEVRGYGRQKSHLEQYRDKEYELTFLPKARLEIYCEDTVAPDVERALLDGARTGRIGDGKVMIGTVEQLETF
jgi:nitrogen regulatory protein P-II 1